MQIRYNFNHRCVIELGKHPEDDLTAYLGINTDSAVDFGLLPTAEFEREYNKVASKPRPNAVMLAAQLWSESTLPKTPQAQAALAVLLTNPEPSVDEIINSVTNLNEGDIIMSTTTASKKTTSKKTGGKRSAKEMKNAKKKSIKKKAGKKAAAPAKTSKKATGDGYKGHRAGSTKGKMHKFFDEKKPDRQKFIAKCEAEGLAASTASSWYGTWNKK